ncbi:MAG: HesA/MoeB/ThiF family protein, partial [Planctomycetota bacterium]
MSTQRPPRPEAAHVLLIGAGGIGCPAAWALVEAGIGKLTIVDPDVVEISNLPRQVLFGPTDVGRSKAEVAADRLRCGERRTRGVWARFDDTTAGDLCRDVDLLLDATDGALTKDWINALAVRIGLPLVHAAGLRSEARILDVPAGGRPCLACLFGRLDAEQGTCADLGVWSGVVGMVGFLAAETALRRLTDEHAPSRGYAVIDLESGRAFSLAAEAAEDCPVCGEGGRPGLEPFPDVATCATGDDRPRATKPGIPVLDLVGEACPMN